MHTLSSLPRALAPTLAARTSRTGGSWRSLACLRKAPLWIATVWIVTAWIALASVAPAAATVLPLDETSLVARADLVVHARLGAAEANETGLSIDIEPLEVIRGTLVPEADGVARLAIPGGVWKGVARRVSEAPRLRSGDEVVLLLRAGGTAGVYRPVDLALGSWRLVTEPDGTRIATRSTEAGTDAGPAFAPRDALALLEWLRLAGTASAGEAPAPLPRDAGSAPIWTSAWTSAWKYRHQIGSSEPVPFGCGSSGGHPLRWFAFDDGGSLSWRAHFDLQPQVPGGLDVVSRALAAWANAPHSTARLGFAGLTASTTGLALSDGVNSLVFEDPNDQIPGSLQEGGTLAATVAWYACEPATYDGRLWHPIVEADIVIQDGVAALAAGLRHPDSFYEQLYGREIGRSLGFELAGAAGSLLRETPFFDLRGAALGVDDLAGLADSYGEMPTEPPAQPTGLVAMARVGDTAIELTWDPPAGESGVYQIERRPLGEAPILVGWASPGATRFLDRRLEGDRMFQYRVRAINAAGISGWSERSEALSDSGLAIAPTVLRAIALGPNEVSLSWRAPACALEPVWLQVFANGRWNTVPFELPAGTESLVLGGLLPNTRYHFRMVTVDESDTLTASNEVDIATRAVAPVCTSDATTLCLFEGRFQARLAFADPFAGGLATAARAVPVTDVAGTFWFFRRQNLEATVEVAAEADGTVTLWLASATDLGIRLDVLDTTTGLVRSLQQDQGRSCGAEERGAFGPVTTEKDAGGPLRWTDTRPWIDRLPAPLRDATPRVDGTPLDDETLVERIAATMVPAPPEKGSTICGAPSPFELPLQGGRFLARLERATHQGEIESARAVDGSALAGYFTFDGAVEGIDWMVKLLDGAAINDRFWLFQGPLRTHEGTTLRIEDTLTGTVRSWVHSGDDRCGQTDLEAFDASTP